MKAKYGCGPEHMPMVRLHSNCSRAWRGIAAGWPMIQANLFWVVRDGRGTRFWRASWIPGIESLYGLLNLQVPIGEEEFPVANYVTNASWDWNRIKAWVPNDICNKIATISPPLAGFSDFPCWRLTSDGQYFP